MKRLLFNRATMMGAAYVAVAVILTWRKVGRLASVLLAYAIIWAHIRRERR